MKQHIEHCVKKEDKKAALVPLKTIWGEAKAWEALAALRLKNVCVNARAGYDEASRASIGCGPSASISTFPSKPATS